MGTFGNLLFLGVGVVGGVVLVNHILIVKSGLAIGPVQWDQSKASSNLLVEGPSITNDGQIPGWDANGDVSIQKISGPGYVEITVPGLVLPNYLELLGIVGPGGSVQDMQQITDNMGRAIYLGPPTKKLMDGIVFGITTNDNITNYADIDYAFKINLDGSLLICENGAPVLDPDVRPGDVLRIHNDNGQVSYLKNGQVIYQSLRPLTNPWRAAVCLSVPGQTLSKTTIVGNSA